MLTPEQIEQRLSYITGSDAAVICGLNQYTTRYQLWLYKTRRDVAPDISGSPFVLAGNMLEEAVAKWFEFATGKETYKTDTFYRHPDIPVLGGNIDRFVRSELAILECKTTQSDKGWGAGYEHGDNKIPDQHLCQVIHYCAVADVERAYIAVLIRGHDFRWYVYERDRELEQEIIDRELKFWNDHVMLDRPPEPISEEEVLQLFDNTSSESVCADREIQEAIDELSVTRTQIKMLEESEKVLRDKICVYMKDRETLLQLDGTIGVRWISCNGKRSFDTNGFKEKYPELYNEFVMDGKPYRRFELKRKAD